MRKVLVISDHTWLSALRALLSLSAGNHHGDPVVEPGYWGRMSRPVDGDLWTSSGAPWSQLE